MWCVARSIGGGGKHGNSYESVLLPGNALALVGVGVGVALDLTGLAAEETVKVGANLVALALLQVVALSAASLEKVGTLLGVTFMAKSVFVFLDLVQAEGGSRGSTSENRARTRAERRWSVKR